MTTVDDAVSIPAGFLAIHVYYTNLPLMTTVDDAVSIPAGFLAIHVYSPASCPIVFLIINLLRP
jgi:hypothetical protein